MKDDILPSGSHWGATQLQRLRYPLQPELKPLESLQWKYTLTAESVSVLENLKRSFGLDEEYWKDQVVRGPYEDFYSLLSEMAPRPQEKLTPKNPALRSNTHLPSSSTHQASSPWSTASTIKIDTFSIQKTPSKTMPSAIGGTTNSDTSNNDSQSEPEEESMPTLISKRQRDGSESPKLPQKILKTSLDTSITPLRGTAFSSSQTDSTFLSSEHSSSEPGDLSDGDRVETGVTVLMQSMLNRICKAHDERNGYTFSVGNDVETLTIPICGSFPKTKPDLITCQNASRT